MTAIAISQNIEKLAGLLQCPSCHRGGLEPAAGERDALCSECGAGFSWDAGYLDLLGDERQRHTLAQRFLQSRAMAMGYSYFRNLLALMLVGYSFEQEVVKVADELELRPGEAVLDIACGHGNFTAAIAERVHPGLVIGLDISRAMLDEAVKRIGRQDLDNVLLLRADVLNLPFRDSSIPKVNCSGGFHQFPELGNAIAGIHRVLQPGGRFSGSSLFQARTAAGRHVQRIMERRSDLHFLERTSLHQKMTTAGFVGFHAERVRWFGYFGAQKQEEA